MPAHSTAGDARAGYEHLEHTADVKVRAWAPLFAEACVQACRGLTAVLTDPDELSQEHRRIVSLEAKSRETLLVDLLSEVIYLHDVDGFLPATGECVVNEENGVWMLLGELRGAVYRGEARHGDVKAMTYSELVIRDESERVTLEFILDL
jgi:SHS2 domain-containing protein